LGGVALKRNWIWPGATVSWRFEKADEAGQVAILVPGATPTHFKVIAFNTTDHPVRAQMTGWNVTAGDWRMTSGVDANGDDKADAPQSRAFAFEKSAAVDVAFAPRQTTVMEFDLVKAGEPVEARADIGVGPDDLKLSGRALSVTVHSLGALDAPAGSLTIEDAGGRVLARAATPPLQAPRDLVPKTAVVKLTLPTGAVRVRIALPDEIREITQLNNIVTLP
jgi:hypothetical protein